MLAELIAQSEKALHVLANARDFILTPGWSEEEQVAELTDAIISLKTALAKAKRTLADEVIYGATADQ